VERLLVAMEIELNGGRPYQGFEPGASCPDKPIEETVRMVVALADVIAPRDHAFCVVAHGAT
jgi:hypothetical protein